MSRSLVAVNAQGRITLPADARRELGLGDGSQLEVSVEGEEIRLRPARLVVAEDAWAYTAESLESIKRSLEDIKAGRVYEMSTDEIARAGSKRSATRKR
jgi:AbrB family looped-hinge helix DNA binding protein